MIDEPHCFGVDPGASFGVAAVHAGELWYVDQGEPTACFERLDDVVRRLVELEADVVIGCERFVNLGGGPRHRRTAQHDAERGVALLLDLGRRLGVPVDLQAPVDAKRLAPNVRLRALGLYVTPSDVNAPDANDANDAVRHALLAMARRRALAFERLLSSRP